MGASEGILANVLANIWWKSYDEKCVNKSL